MAKPWRPTHPLPRRLACRLCDRYDTGTRSSHARARFLLGRHVEAEHPDSYRDILARAGRPVDADASRNPSDGADPGR